MENEAASNVTQPIPKKKHYTRLSQTKIIEALKNSGGLVTIIAQKLNCSRQQLHRWINENSAVKQAFLDERETIVDLAESELVKQVKAGNMTAIIFTLKCQGKDRGYVERTEHEFSGKGGTPLEFVYKVVGEKREESGG